MRVGLVVGGVVVGVVIGAVGASYYLAWEIYKNF